MGDIVQIHKKLSNQEVDELMEEAVENLDRAVEIYLILENYVSSAKLLQQISLKAFQCAEIANKIHIVKER